jgi:hypothetical protein
MTEGREVTRTPSPPQRAYPGHPIPPQRRKSEDLGPHRVAGLGVLSKFPGRGHRWKAKG